MPSQGEKKQVAVRIPLRQKVELEREAAEQGDSRSEYIRSILRDRHLPEQLSREVERKEDRIAELEHQLTERSRVEEKIDELPDKITDDESYRDRERRVWNNGSTIERLKWRITGIPVEEED
jgi:predicted  nucleic acid-binding Zn-ribbon protein